MTQSTLSSKGQITVPAAVRRELKIGEGDKLEFIEIEKGRFEIIAVTREASSLKGIINTSNKATIEEMNKSISDSASR
jgi:AbrB family looped-hinge helix DNA binding protein